MAWALIREGLQAAISPHSGSELRRVFVKVGVLSRYYSTANQENAGPYLKVHGTWRLAKQKIQSIPVLFNRCTGSSLGTEPHCIGCFDIVSTCIEVDIY